MNKINVVRRDLGSMYCAIWRDDDGDLIVVLNEELGSTVARAAMRLAMRLLRATPFTLAFLLWQTLRRYPLPAATIASAATALALAVYVGTAPLQPGPVPPSRPPVAAPPGPPQSPPPSPPAGAPPTPDQQEPLIAEPLEPAADTRIATVTETADEPVRLSLPVHSPTQIPEPPEPKRPPQPPKVDDPEPPAEEPPKRPPAEDPNLLCLDVRVVDVDARACVPSLSLLSAEESGADDARGASQLHRVVKGAVRSDAAGAVGSGKKIGRKTKHVEAAKSLGSPRAAGVGPFVPPHRRAHADASSTPHSSPGHRGKGYSLPGSANGRLQDDRTSATR